MHRLRIQHRWDGQAIPPAHWISLDLAAEEAGLRITVDAPHWASPPPPKAPPGPTDRLWEYEVVELFIAGPSARYTEVELGPGGHHLVLTLDGIRTPTASGLALDFSARIQGDRWTGVAILPWSAVPPGPHRINATAIHGVGLDRQYLSWQPLDGDSPDFHQLDRFAPVVLRPKIAARESAP